MITRMISDEELVKATALVQAAMLASLPEPEDCTGEFSEQFEVRIDKLKKTAKRKASWRKFTKTAVAAVLVVLVGFAALLTFSTETRAAVRLWIRESFGNVTTYWFQESEVKTLPEYELTWVPENCERIYDESSDTGRVMLYQNGSDILDGFTFNYSLANDSSKLMVESLYGKQTIETVDVWGKQADFYPSSHPDDSHGLVWFDEPNGVVLYITSFYDLDDILRIANGVRIVE